MAAMVALHSYLVRLVRFGRRSRWISQFHDTKGTDDDSYVPFAERPAKQHWRLSPPARFRCFIDARVLIGELISAWLREQLSYRRACSPSRAHGGPSAFFP
jgi:hypothetical protein